MTLRKAPELNLAAYDIEHLIRLAERHVETSEFSTSYHSDFVYRMKKQHADYKADRDQWTKEAQESHV